MGFFKQTWFGIKKEFAVYKNNPRSLIIKSISLVISVILTIITGRQNQDDLSTALTTNALWHIIVFYMPARVTLEKVSHERETSFKEYLMVNGMSKAAYQAKIATSNYIEVLWYAISQSISIYVGYYQYLTSALDIVQVFFIVFFGGTATINMALFYSTLMEPQNASSIGSMIILILGLLYYVGTAIESMYAYIAFSFHPTAGLALAINSLIAQNDPTMWDGYTGYIGLIILACSSVYYLALYLYNERDRDADSKAAKKRKLTSDRHFSLPLIEDGGSISSVRDIESQAQDYTSAIHYEKLLDLGPRVKTIEASHLTKQFPECTAVNDISFSIYEREIFCLLGHNGAGKTTLVSLLTGLIPKTDGSFFYNGEEVFSNLDKIRGSIGFCPQKDYLLMENTVYENLSFFAEIKEIPADRMEVEIERVMNKLGLETFKDMPAKKLSGGFKRKLNVGIALLNDPKIIIMDEPTSGMDPVSRRNFWNIIKGLKNELKTVVLTTQFIDEAEELADRVAIMAKGKLFAVGSSDFIKKKFGTGYNLTIQDSNNSVDIKNRAKELFAKIQSIIPSATQHFNASATTLQFTLPFQDQSKFSALFTELERISDLQINLQMVSLEEAFVSLGLNAEKALQTSNESENQENSAYQTRVPSSFFRERKPTFKDQLGALLLLRWYKVLKNKRFMFFASFPLIFVFAGVGVGNNTSDPQTGFALFLTLLITGNAFLMNTFAIPPITERLTKITYVLKAMGLQSRPYWLGNLIVDFIVKVIFSLLIFAAIYIFNVGYLQEIIGPLVGIYLAFSFYMIIYSYTISLVFDSVPAIMVASPSLFLAGAFLPSVLAAIVDGVFDVQSMMVFGIISFILFGPAMILQFGVTALVSETYQSPQYGPHLPFQQYWAYIIVSIGMGILYFILLTYIESRTYELKDKKIYKENEEDDAFTEIEQEDVVREKERLASPFNQHAIKTVEVQKVYPNGFKALHDLTFGVEKNQIFCLLGPNGAGKTTSFEIVTATIPKTKGLVEIGGKELSRSNAEIFQEIGMCSQSNTLWDFLTVEHHLRIYARLKGMDKTETDEAVEYLQNLLQLTEYTNRGADKLSGGNKRKLCVAISMIGAPKYIFLDEPSTGMDPLARNYLWTLIKDVMKGKQGSMVLTTHYMQEAELVADKLGILVNGRFATIGSLQELKKKFGEYTIAIYETEGGYSKNQIEELVRSVLPEVKQRSGSDERGVTFKVSPQLMKFGQLFFKLEETKSEGKIKDFSIFTTTLEQIFIKLAKHQRRLTES